LSEVLCTIQRFEGSSRPKLGKEYVNRSRQDVLDVIQSQSWAVVVLVEVMRSKASAI